MSLLSPICHSQGCRSSFGVFHACAMQRSCCLVWQVFFFAYTMVNCSRICIVRCIEKWLTIFVPFIDVDSSTFIRCTDDFASRLCFTTAMDPSSLLSLMIPLNLTMIFNIYMSLLCHLCSSSGINIFQSTLNNSQTSLEDSWKLLSFYAIADRFLYRWFRLFYKHLTITFLHHLYLVASNFLTSFHYYTIRNKRRFFTCASWMLRYSTPHVPVPILDHRVYIMSILIFLALLATRGRRRVRL